MAEISIALERKPARRVEPLASMMIFYLAIPLVHALVLGAASSGSGRFSERWAFFLYPVSGGIPTWLLSWAATWAAAILLRPWRPHLLVVTTIGAIVAIHLSAPITEVRHHIFEPLLLPGAHFFQVFPWRYNDPHFLLEAVIVWTTSSFIWGACNAFWVYFLGYSRFGYSAAGAQPAAAAPSVADREAAQSDLLTSRLPVAVARDIIALRAEQHYTRVYSRTQDVLILMRFSDAVRSLGAADGLQVHRSHWVRPSAVTALERTNGGYRLVLANGLHVPVGRSFNRVVENAGLAPGPTPAS